SGHRAESGAASARTSFGENGATMSGPAFGVELFQFPPRVTLDDVRRAEQLGYDSAWLGDAQLLWRDLYVMLGAAAAQTATIALGSSLTNPVTRLPSVTAGAIATLHEL